MPSFLLIASAVIVICIILNKISYRMGIPALLAFILLGILFGNNGIVKVPDDILNFAEKVCSIALIFIMFYGGFSSKWTAAKPVAAQSILLASFGVVITAILTGLFCYFAFDIGFLESMLIGSVISSTDAASVFFILRSKKLNLKENTASLLEVESGSNDPSSYMLMVIFISIIQGKAKGTALIYLVFAQIVYGVLIGAAIAVLAVLALRKIKFISDGFDSIFVLAIALLSFAAPTVIKGNGYLSAYVAGIIIGNSAIPNKKALVHFFDGVTGLTQMLIFFLLGLLAVPSALPAVALKGLLIALFLTFVARPVAVFSLMAPFKGSTNQKLLVSWAGLRGAASIVFAVMAINWGIELQNDLFHITFFIVLFSILFHGSLLPPAARLLKMTDDAFDVMKTFTDYTEHLPVQFIQISIGDENQWINKQVKEISLPDDTLLVLLQRDGKNIVPKGQTVIKSGDELILSAKSPSDIEGICLSEKLIEKGDPFIDKKIYEIDNNKNELIIMVQRGGKIIIPNGQTVIKEKDLLVINHN